MTQVDPRQQIAELQVALNAMAAQRNNAMDQLVNNQVTIEAMRQRIEYLESVVKELDEKRLVHPDQKASGTVQ